MSEQALRRSFVAALPDRIVGLEMACERWRLARHHDIAQALDEFYRLSHNLAGAAALYGFEQVSVPCRELECHLRALRRGAGSVEGGDGDGVARLLALIREVAKRVQHEAARPAYNNDF